MTVPSKEQLDTIFYECRQCGLCCKTYKKILLMPDEIDYMKKMGAHVGIMVKMNDLQENTMDQLVKEAREKDDVFMIHPDDKGCLFLSKKNAEYKCDIYHYRPKTCRQFKCSLAENSLMHLIFKDPLCLL